MDLSQWEIETKKYEAHIKEEQLRREGVSIYAKSLIKRLKCFEYLLNNIDADNTNTNTNTSTSTDSELSRFIETDNGFISYRKYLWDCKCINGTEGKCIKCDRISKIKNYTLLVEYNALKGVLETLIHGENDLIDCKRKKIDLDEKEIINVDNDDDQHNDKKRHVYNEVTRESNCQATDNGKPCTNKVFILKELLCKNHYQKAYYRKLKIKHQI